MKKILVLFMSILLILSFSLVSCKKQEPPQKKESVTESGGYDEKEVPKAGGYGEPAPVPETGGYGEKEAPVGGYGGGY